jgi:hypothetical protein
MDNIDDQFWRPFAHLVEQYPHDHGLRMASDLARRLGEQWQRVHGRSPTANEVPTEPSQTAVGCTALAALYPRNEPATPLYAMAVATTHVQLLHRAQLDNPGPAENVAKPWKKPWDA